MSDLAGVLWVYVVVSETHSRVVCHTRDVGRMRRCTPDGCLALRKERAMARKARPCGRLNAVDKSGARDKAVTFIINRYEVICDR